MTDSGNHQSTAYDVIVIGAGQAGPGIAAARAGEGRRVALVEMEQIGGTCLNHGCRPTKALRASALAAHRARRAGGYGVDTGEVRVNYPEAIGRVHRMIAQMRRSLAQWLDGIDNLDLVTGRATLRTDRVTGVHRVQVGKQTLTAPEIHLDVGGRASVPDIPGLANVPHLTEVELLELDELPHHLVIIGGGYIGLEFGQMFRRLGSEVTMLVGSGIATREDPDVSAAIADVLIREGVRIVAARPDAVDERAGDIVVRAGGDTVEGTHLLVATGRVSNSDLLGDDHGLETDERGFFTIGPRFETSVPGVWALGDVNGHGAFTHTAYQDSQILLDEQRTVSGRVTTYAMFTDPVLGRVGMTSRQARASGRRVLVAQAPMSSITRAVLEGETAGLLRILVDGDTEEFLGATVLGLHADDLVQTISFAMQSGISYPSLRDALPIHPTMAEYLPALLTTLSPLET